MHRIFRFAVGGLAFIISLHSFAHQLSKNLPETGVSARVATTYRDASIADYGVPYLIPGAMLGGEAIDVQKNINLDDAQLLAHYRFNNNYSVSSKLSAHQHSDDNAIEMENLWLTFDATQYVGKTKVEVGRMTTETTTTAYFHAAESEFSEASLLSDVFFGRHFNDTGIKFSYSPKRFHVGIEAWNGSAWPASAGETNLSAFAKLRHTRRSLNMELGVWAMKGSAKQRSDQRYAAVHQHSGIQLEPSTSMINFTGDIDMQGGYFRSTYERDQFYVTLDVESIVAESKGRLQDNGSQQSRFDATHEGNRVQLTLGFGQHSITVRQEELILENIFLDSISQLFLEQSGLQNDGFNPSKTVAVWQWQVHKDFSLRLESINEKIISNEPNQRLGIGLVWRRWLFR